jgi:hypothetical protein
MDPTVANSGAAIRFPYSCGADVASPRNALCQKRLSRSYVARPGSSHVRQQRETPQGGVTGGLPCASPGCPLPKNAAAAPPLWESRSEVLFKIKAVISLAWKLETGPIREVGLRDYACGLFRELQFWMVVTTRDIARAHVFGE